MLSGEIALKNNHHYYYHYYDQRFQAFFGDDPPNIFDSADAPYLTCNSIYSESELLFILRKPSVKVDLRLNGTLTIGLSACLYLIIVFVSVSHAVIGHHLQVFRKHM